MQHATEKHERILLEAWGWPANQVPGVTAHPAFTLTGVQYTVLSRKEIADPEPALGTVRVGLGGPLSIYVRFKDGWHHPGFNSPATWEQIRDVTRPYTDPKP